MPDKNSSIIDISLQLGNVNIRSASSFSKASGEIKTPDGHIWKILERSPNGCIAKSTTKLGEVRLVYCCNCPNKDSCKKNG